MNKKVFSFALALVLALCLPLLSQTAFAAGLYLNKTDYKAGETIIVTTTRVTEQMQSDSAWVGIYKKGAAHSDYGKYDYVKAGTNKVALKAPEQQGLYEVRMFKQSRPYDNTTFVAKASFQIGGVVAPPPANATVSLGKVYAPGEAIVVATNGITKRMVQDKAFVAIYKAGSAHGEPGTYAYPQEGDGQVQLAAPKEAGAYEIRLYKKDGEYTSASFTSKVPFNVALSKK